MLSYKDVDWPCAQAFFVGLHLEHATSSDANARDGADDGSAAQRSFDLREPIFKFLEAVSAWPECQTYHNQFELQIKHVRLAELEQWLENRNKGLPANSKDAQLASAISSTGAGKAQGVRAVDDGVGNKHCSF